MQSWSWQPERADFSARRRYASEQPPQAAIKLLKFFLSGVSFTAMDMLILLVGCTVSYIVSLLVIEGLMNYVRKHSFSAFGVYRIVLGIAVLLYFLVIKK